MTRTEARDLIVRDPGRVLRPARKEGYICPICDSGSREHGTGITTRDGRHFTCWAGCYKNADIIDILALRDGVKGYNAKLENACREYGIDYNELESDPELEPRGKGRELDWNDEITNPSPRKEKMDPQKGPADTTGTDRTDYLMFYKECVNRLGETDYLQRRGISEAVAKSFLIGYCPNWRSPKALKDGKNPPATPRLIIPISRRSYIARDTRPDEVLKETEKQFRKMKTGKIDAIFNQMTLLNADQPVFVTEGELDAVSIVEVGFRAVALGSTAMCSRLIDVVKEDRPTVPLLIALDADDAGRKASKRLMKDLQELGIICREVSVCGLYKDPNERLINDREGLKAALTDAVDAVKEAEERDRKEYLETTGNDYFLKAFINGVAEGADTVAIPTGFRWFDNILDRGLYPSLIVLGAIPSLGKTSLILQIADQIAMQGHDVLFFSLEMSRTELMSKSLSRLTAQIAEREGMPIKGMAKTARGISTGAFYRRYSQEERALIDRAVKEYGEFARHIRVIEGVMDFGMAEIRAAVKRHITFTGSTPLIIIDYLQILAPDNPKATDKQNTDKCILELKRLSRDFNTPVIAISSFNRPGYGVEAGMTSFKESGSIEFSADLLLGLQAEGVGTAGFDANRAKRQDPRRVELAVLKNRNGKTGDIIKFEYRPAYSLFKETGVVGDAGAKEAYKEDEPRLTRREAQRQEIRQAIEAVRRDGISTLSDVADRLDISTRAVLNRMRDLGLKYILKDGALSEWEEIDQRDDPFEGNAETPV